MGFPLAYMDLHFPKLLLQALSILGFIRKIICAVLKIMGLGDFLEPEFPYPNRPESCGEARLCSLSAQLIRELLPVVRFSEIEDPPESCAVCLYEFDTEDEIRRLANCPHVFHRSCVDRWMDHDRKTCPLCRTQFIPVDMMVIFNEKLRLASGISDFCEDYSYAQTSL